MNEESADAAARDRVIGVGIVGFGFMGRTHAACYAAQRGCSVRALFDPAARHAVGGNLIAATHAGAVDSIFAATPRATSVDELLARDDVELVSICTPTDTHVELVRAAIRARKHVLVEKPTALDASIIESLSREAEHAGVLVMPAHCMRYWPAWSWMAEAIRTQRFGRARRASFRRLGARPAWSQDFYLDVSRSGGAIIDLHIHDADFVRWAFGEPDAVEARGTRMHVVARYRYETGPHAGVTIEAEGGWMDDPSFAFTMVATIECERAVIDFRLGREPELMVVENGSPRAVSAGIAYPNGTGYDHEIAALLDAIRAGNTQAPVTLSDAARTQRLLDRELAAL